MAAASRNSSPLFPPFTLETANLKVRTAEDAWNSRDPEKVSLAYTIDSNWRNRAEFLSGREEIVQFERREVVAVQVGRTCELEPALRRSIGEEQRAVVVQVIHVLPMANGKCDRHEDESVTHGASGPTRYRVKYKYRRARDRRDEP